MKAVPQISVMRFISVPHFRALHKKSNKGVRKMQD